MELEGKKIIVTGGGSGIAAGCVRGYVRAGAQVVFCDVNDEGGRTTETEANAQEGVTGKATYIHCDITKKENVADFFAKAIEIMGGLDVLANIAGVERNKPAETFVEEDIDFVMGVNFKGTVWTNQEAYKYFRANGIEGAIINYASDTGLSGMPNGQGTGHVHQRLQDPRPACDQRSVFPPRQDRRPDLRHPRQALQGTRQGSPLNRSCLLKH